MENIRWLKYLRAYSLPAFKWETYVGDFLPPKEQRKIEIPPHQSMPDANPTIHTANFRGFVLDNLEEIEQYRPKINSNREKIEERARKMGATIIAEPFGRFEGRKALNGAYLLYKPNEGAQESFAMARRRT